MVGNRSTANPNSRPPSKKMQSIPLRHGNGNALGIQCKHLGYPTCYNLFVNARLMKMLEPQEPQCNTYEDRRRKKLGLDQLGNRPTQRAIPKPSEVEQEPFQACPDGEVGPPERLREGRPDTLFEAKKC